jgi:hypothetical protein
MDRTRREAAVDPQLTLDEWEHTLNETEPVGTRSSVVLLAEALAPRLAKELSMRTQVAATSDPPTARLLTLDELVAQLPPAKRPQTWKRWLYERTRRGEVPGCVKLGGMLFFEREPALAWLRGGAVTK